MFMVKIIANIMLLVDTLANVMLGIKSSFGACYVFGHSPVARSDRSISHPAAQLLHRFPPFDVPSDDEKYEAGYDDSTTNAQSHLQSFFCLIREAGVLLLRFPFMTLLVASELACQVPERLLKIVAFQSDVACNRKGFVDVLKFGEINADYG
jgi:hypothetical protein